MFAMDDLEVVGTSYCSADKPCHAIADSVCSVLQCVALLIRCAACCSVLHCWFGVQRVAVCCSALQCVAVCTDKPRHAIADSVLQCVAVCCSVCCSVLQCVAVWADKPWHVIADSEYGVLQWVSVYFCVLQCVAVCCSVRRQALSRPCSIRMQSAATRLLHVCDTTHEFVVDAFSICAIWGGYD